MESRCVVPSRFASLFRSVFEFVLSILAITNPQRVFCQIWPVCHLNDNTSLYMAILHAILSGPEHIPPHGRDGYYLAASGSVAWINLYTAMARRLAQRGIVDDDKVEPATPEILYRMATALKCPVEMVALQLGGWYVVLERLSDSH